MFNQRHNIPSLNRIFTVNFILIFLISLFLFSFLGFFILKDIELQHTQESLKRYVSFIKKEFGKNRDANITDLNKVFSELSIDLKVEVNLISKIEEKNIGKFNRAIYKNHYESHTDKIIIYEVFELNKVLFLYSFSHSKRMQSDFFMNIWGEIMLIFASLISLGMFQMYSVNRRIKQEIGKINSYLDSIQSKQYVTVIDLNYSIELFKIGKKLQKVITRLRKRDKQKQKYTAKLKFANKQHENLLNAISHELKNPIASIIGYTDILKDELSKNSSVSEMQKKFLVKIFNNSKRIDELLNRLRFAVQLENNKFQLENEEFNIIDTINNVLSNLKSEYQERNIEVIFDKKVTVFADQTLINLVVVNLVENGLKYSENKLLVEVKNNILSVRDYGQGIEEDQLSKITNKFYRINENHSQQSMGLGLAIVSYILRLHNLELNISSVLNEGTTFSMNLEPILKENISNE